MPDFPQLTLALQVNGGGGVNNPIISLTKVTYFFCVIAGQFLGNIFENSISCKHSLQVIFHDIFC